MKHDEMIELAGKNFDEINRLAKKIIHHFNAEDIHDFRVNIKKFRAFLRMASMENDDSGKYKLPKRLKKFYEIAGNIRSLQLQEQHIKKVIKETYIKQPGNYL